MRRGLLWGAVGVVVAALLVRQLSTAGGRLDGSTPDAAPLTGLGAWWQEVRAGMAEREVELRAAVGLDGTHDQVDAHTLGPSAAARRPVMPDAPATAVGGA